MAMTAEQYEMSFGQWCNRIQGMNLMLTEYGDIDWREPKNRDAEQYKVLWVNLRHEFSLRAKNEKIMNALQAIRKAGFDGSLCNYQNGHIKAKSKHGIVYSYYATTGTIAGYRDTCVNGLDEFIRMCEEK